MIALWVQLQYNTHSVITPSALVVRGSLTAVPNAVTRIEGVSYLSPRNSDGDDRAASPGWGGTAPSKSLIGRHWLETETTANTLATRSRIGHKQQAITAVSLGAWQRLSLDSETRTGIDSYREGLNHLFNGVVLHNFNQTVE